MTKLNYLTNSHLYSSTGSFIEMKESEKGTAIIITETIFYPQGGGQPSDQGTISTENAVFDVAEVRLDQDGLVWHFGTFKNGSFNSGENVNLNIDKARRDLNSRLHSAGHLLDCAIEKLGMLQQLPPGKAFQFPPTPYVEYDGVIENLQEKLSEIEMIVNQLVSSNIPVKAEILTSEEAEQRHLFVPKGKPARIVTFEGFSDSGCGGTHVDNSGEIGKIEITKIKSKDGKTRIYFLLV